jgi:hypothetical protein
MQGQPFLHRVQFDAPSGLVTTTLKASSRSPLANEALLAPMSVSGHFLLVVEMLVPGSSRRGSRITTAGEGFPKALSADRRVGEGQASGTESGRRS